MHWNHIYGNHNTIDRLMTFLQTQTIPHAMIFSGPQGIGKTTLSKILAGVLLCFSSETNGRCGRCKSCAMFGEGTHPDFLEVVPKKESIGVDEVREMLKHMQNKPLFSENKVYLISGEMTISAQNAILKNLEEPFKNVFVIINTSHLEQLLDTVKSRAVLFLMQKNSREDMLFFLNKKYPKKQETFPFVVRYADGNIGKAVQVIENKQLQENRDLALRLLQNCVDYNQENMFILKKELIEKKHDTSQILDLSFSMVRDSMVLQNEEDEHLVHNIDKLEELRLISLQCSMKKSIALSTLIYDTIRALEQKANLQSAIESMLIRAIYKT